jgi:type IV pilus assembly protein PilC
MTTFAYVALDTAGKRATGYVDANDRDAAIANLTTQGRMVLEIKEEAKQSKEHQASSGRISRGDVALFTRRMADLAAAGLPLDRVLQVVAEQSESPRLTAIAEQALTEVRSGLPVSEALALYPKIFPVVYTQTLRAGEASGQFGEVAARLADFQEKEVARRSQIVSALTYPVILCFVAIFVVVFLIAFVMPKLTAVFSDLGGQLPVSTQFLLLITNAVTHYYLFIIGGLVAAFLVYKAWVSTDAGAAARDALLFKMPLVGPVLKKAIVSRFARVLGTLVFGGVPILESLRISGMSAGNRTFARGAIKVEGEVREGRPIAEAMRDAGQFPPVLTHMVAIGEETGDLPKMLGRVSDSLDFEVDNGLRRLVAIVEPAIILIMGLIVGFVVLSVLLPIFQAQELVK